MSLVNPRSTHPPAKVMIFIDGGYLKKWIETKCKLKLDEFNFSVFSEYVTGKALGNLDYAQIIRTYYYDGLANPSEKVYKKQKKINDLINSFPNFDVRIGHLVKDGQGKFRQKGVDVLMAIDMIDKANSNQYDIAIIVAGDLDHLEAIKTIKNKGKQVFGVFYKGSVSKELRQHFDNDYALSKDDEKLFSGEK